MSLNPERLPVTVYKSTDIDAPQMTIGNAGNFRMIAKQCLVTGYGTKASAGWSAPFENIQDGIVTLRPPLSAEQDFYLHLSADDGKQATVKVYTDMTDINTGDLKMESDNSYKYGDGTLDGKWMLIATTRGFWFFNSFSQALNGVPKENTGAYFYCGDTVANSVGVRGLYLKHTGGRYALNNRGRRESIFASVSSYVESGKLMTLSNIDNSTDPKSTFYGNQNLSSSEILSPIYILSNNEIYFLPAFGSSRHDKPNYHEEISTNRTFINHGVSTYRGTFNFYVPVDFWEL